MLKIAITGPESTGKSTLSDALAKHFNCAFVKEYAREYLNQTEGKYNILDLDTIAQKQNEMIESAQDNRLIISDTEMTVMKVWSEFKYGTCSPNILKLYQQQNFDYYFLCDIDIPWQDDPLREHPEKRQELLACYQKELKGKNYLLLSGSLDHRIKQASKIISQLLSELKN
jgi:NadR type nicotinamide-nucleotide adenylyltransferase